LCSLADTRLTRTFFTYTESSRCRIFAFGHSDGDHQMLQWTAAGPGARFMGLVHHTDAERE
jgi:hypothetical protein